MNTSITTLRKQLRALASPESATVLQRFFKTGPGQYGEGDVFLGIRAPILRAFAKECGLIDLKTIGLLLESHYHEERVFALLLLMHFYQKASDTDQTSAFQLYLDNTHRINNWDLVDISAPHIVGRYLANRSRKVLPTLARSSLLWERRIAIVSTFHFIRLNDFDDTLRLAKILLHDEHDLMHKAVGWMLREVGKRNQNSGEEFLKAHYHTMPRTMLRYAIERFPEKKRRDYLLGKI